MALTLATILRNLFQGGPENSWKGILNPHRPPTEADIKAALLIDKSGYSFVKEATPVNAVAASGILTGTALAVAASGILTSDNTEVADGDRVTIGNVVYVFKDTPTVAYDVQRDGTTADTTMGNLVKAINGTGTPGVEYFEETEPHPDVTAGTLAAHAFTVTAKVKGTEGNAIAKAEDSDHLDWDGTGEVLSGGIAGIRDGDTVTIGTTVYTMKAALTSPAVAYEVLIGVSVSATLDNLIAAITADTGAGTLYGTGTLVHPLVTAAAGTGDTIDVTAKTKGVLGNTIAKAEDSAGLDWDGTGSVLSGGIDGTAAPANAMCADATYLYHCVAENTISGANWRRISLGSAF